MRKSVLSSGKWNLRYGEAATVDPIERALAPARNRTSDGAIVDRSLQVTLCPTRKTWRIDMDNQIRHYVTQLIDRPSGHQLLTVKQAADRLCLSPRTIYRMINDDQLQAIKLRGATRIKDSALADLLDERDPEGDNSTMTQMASESV